MNLRFLFVAIGIFLMPQFSFAEITASQTEGCAPLASVQFSNSYPGATNINWDLGNGASSSSASPINSYSEPGVYNVIFTATVNGSPVNESLTITVYANPVADFTFNPSAGVCLGNSLQFQDNSQAAAGSNLTNWQWSFGDGTPSQTGQNPSHQYANVGTYDVTLIVTDNNGCNASTTLFDEVIVSQAPVANFTTSPNPPVACEAPLLVSFTNNSSSNSPTGGPLTYNWNFGNGETSNQQSPPPINYTDEGVYTVSLIVTDDVGCQSQDNIVVSLQEPEASISVVNAVNGTSCSQIELAIDGTPGGVFAYGDGTVGTSLFHTYATEGTYTITYSINVAGCSASAETTVNIEIPTAVITSDPGFACSKPAEFNYSLNSTYTITDFTWNFPDGSTSTNANPSNMLDYEGPNEYAINGLKTFITSVNFTTSNGCPGTAFITDSISLPNALMFPSTNQGCVPLTVDFTDQSAHHFGSDLVDWEWHFGDGTILNENSSTDPSHTYTALGEYDAFLIVTNDVGCIDTSFFQPIYVGEELNPSFVISPSTVCPGEEFSITNTSSDLDLIDSYAYSGDMHTLGECLSEASPSFYFDDIAGTQTITQFVEYNGCISQSTQSIQVNGPVAKVSYSCNCDTPFDYTFEAEVYDAESWTWDFGDGNIIQDSSDPIANHTYENTGDYTVTLTSVNNTSGCQPYVSTTLVKVRDLSANISMEARACFGEEVMISATGSVDVGVDDGCRHDYLWEFDDGSRPVKTTAGFIPHTFLDNGINTVTLTVKDDNECVKTVSQEIQVYDIAANYEADTLYGCPPLEVNFTDLSTADTTIVSWEWNFDDGSPTNVDQNPNHTFTDAEFDASNNPLPYQITLIVTDILGCSNEIDELIIQPLGPNPAFQATSSTNICVGDEVSFEPTGSNVSFHTYDWNYGNGATSQGAQGNAEFVESGEYEITLVVTDSVGCARELTQQIVSVQDYPVAIIDPSYEDDEILCYPVIVDYADASINPIPGSNLWDLNQGGPTSTGPATSTTYTLPGEYQVDLTVTSSYGCQHDTTLISVVEGPLGEITLDPGAICPGGSISLNLADTADLAFWSFTLGDGSSIANELPTNHTYAPEFIPNSGATNIVLVMHSPDSACSAGREIPLIIEEVIAGFDVNSESSVLDSIHCYGTPELLTNTSSANATIFDWEVVGAGVTFASQHVEGLILPVGTNIIELIVESNLGCRDTISKTIEIFPLPEPTITEGTAICQGEEYILTADGGTSYNWSPTTGLDDPSSNVVVASPNSTTTYTVTVTDDNECSNSISSEIFVYQPPPSISQDTTMRIGDYDIAGFYIGEGYTYEWTPDIYLECDTCAITEFRPLEDIVYTLTISDTLGCFNVASFFSYTILEVKSVALPDAFTPNGDGVNDIIYVKGWGIEEIMSFQIYNRWGELVFETNDINEGWDGTYKGELQNADSYAYVVVAKNFISEQPETYKGFIDLIR